MGLGSKNNLEKLNVTSCKFTFKGAQALFSVLGRNYKLRELIIDKNSLDGKRLRVIRENLMTNNSLVTLSMNQCLLGEDGAFYIAHGVVKNKKLKHLYLAGNDFGDEGFSNFSDVISNYNFGVETLDLSNNSFTDRGAIIFAKGLTLNTSLLTLLLR